MDNKKNAIIPALALITAVMAIAISVWEGYENRKHNHLSVKPILMIEAWNTMSKPRVGLELTNSGTGPAIIKEWNISVGNKFVGTFLNGWLKALNESELGTINRRWVHYRCMETLQSGENLPILFVNLSDWKELGAYEKKAFNEAMRIVNIEIKYESIYKEPAECKYDGSVDWIW